MVPRSKNLVGSQITVILMQVFFILLDDHNKILIHNTIFNKKYLFLALGKQGLMHVRKVLSQISLCLCTGLSGTTLSDSIKFSVERKSFLCKNTVKTESVIPY